MLRGVEATTVEHRPRTIAIRSLGVEVISGPDAGAVHNAQSDTMSIGTAARNDLVLTDETVSRYHVELRHVDGRIRVRDLDSTNRTVVGGVQLGWADVDPGTVVRLGRTDVRILSGGPIAVDLIEGEDLFGVRGYTASMRALMKKAQRVAQSDTSVLIEGETGTGKEMFARAIHQSSPRRDEPFETVDCGALLPSLVLSELFGHEAGAFTGANERRIGAFERADGGTIFLDEIGELPADLQPSLLGALERRSFKRVGGAETISVDVRVLSATNRDLREAVNQRTFREDLFYRLGVVTLHLPALRERSADIMMLATHFAHEAGASGGIEEVLTPEDIDALMHHRWPGNVRELRNFVEAAFAMGEAPALSGGGERPASSGGGNSMIDEQLMELTYRDARAQLLEQFERMYLDRLLERTGGNVAKAARTARMNRSYLTDLLKRHKMR